MKYIKILFLLISQLIIVNKINAQCPEAQNYISKIEQADSWTPTERVSSGDKIQAWTQLGTWHNYRCECENGGNLSDTDLQRLVDHLNMIKGQISSKYSSYGSVPSTSISDCKKKAKNGSNVSSKLNNNSNSKSSTQIEMENRLVNYNNAMNLKTQGENIARAYAQQVKSYGQLNSTSTPEALLENFNSNMQAIADLEAQNKADNLSQVSNTLSSSLNDLSTGNYEGAMFSALSLLDQGEAKREAKRKAEATKRRLAYQVQQKMTAFYTKAVEITDEAINLYYEKAAFTYSKEEEAYMLAYIDNLECHKKNMDNNFSYNNTSWLKNNCSVPVKKNYTVNNLVPKDIQYINAAKRKYVLYKKTGEQVFQKGAMRFAGLAATENPKADYYYTMGHYAGINNPLVAYSSFLTAKSKSLNYFSGEKASEFALVKLSLESSFKKAIEENDQEEVSNIVGAGLHQTVKIDNSLPIIYAIKIDKADVVFAFLNTDLVGKPQSVINKKVQSTLYMAALLNAPNTIQKFVDLGFSIDFNIDGKTPLDAAEESLSLNSFTKIEEILGGQSKYTKENSDLFKMLTIETHANVNDSLKAKSVFNSLTAKQSKHKALELLLKAKERESFFLIYEENKENYANWFKENRNEIFEQFANDIIYARNRHVYRYLSSGLLNLSTDKNCLYGDDLALFNKVWLKHDMKYIDPNISTWNKQKYKKLQEQQSSSPFDYLPKKPQSLQWFVSSQIEENHIAMNDINQSNNDTWLINSLQIIKIYDDVFPQIFEVDLFSLAVWRRDYKLLKILHQEGHFTPNILWYVPGTSFQNDRYKDINPDLYLESIENTCLMLNYLINEMGNSITSFEVLVSKRFNQYGNNFSETDNECYKSILDKLIENGQGNINIPISNKKHVLKQIKSWEDGKYWKAILKGEFDKRY